MTVDPHFLFYCALFWSFEPLGVCFFLFLLCKFRVATVRMDLRNIIREMNKLVLQGTRDFHGMAFAEINFHLFIKIFKNLHFFKNFVSPRQVTSYMQTEILYVRPCNSQLCNLLVIFLEIRNNLNPKHQDLLI